MKHKKNRVFTNGTTLLVSGIISYMISLLYRVVIVGYVGNVMVSDYSMMYVIYDIVYISFTYAVVNVIAKAIQEKNRKKFYKTAQKIFRVCLILVSFIIGILGLIFYFGKNILADRILGIEGKGHLLKWLFIPISLCILCSIFRGYFFGNGADKAVGFTIILESIVNLEISTLLVIKFKKISSLEYSILKASIIGLSISNAISLMLLLFIYIVNMPIIKKRMDRSLEIDDKSSEDSIVYLFVNVLKDYLFWVKRVILLMRYEVIVFAIWGLLNLISKVLFKKIMFNSTNSIIDENILLGVNEKVMLLLTVPVLITFFLGSSSIVRLRTEAIRGNFAKVRNFITVAIRYNMMIILPCIMIIIIGSKKVMNFLHQEDLTNVFASKVLVIGGVSMLFFTLAITEGKILLDIDMKDILLKNVLFGFCMHIFVEIAMLYGNMRNYAIIIAYLVFAFVVFILNSWSVINAISYKVDLLKVIVIPIASSCIMGIVSSITINLVYKLIGIDSISMLFGIFLGALIYFVSIVVFGGISEDELLCIPKGKRIIEISKKIHLI